MPMQSKIQALVCSVVNMNYFLSQNSTEVEAKLCDEAAHLIRHKWQEKFSFLIFPINTSKLLAWSL